MSTQILSAVHPAVPSRMLLLPGCGRPRIVASQIALTRVKRCLFGMASDPEESIRQAQCELERQAEADSKRWSFDFARDRPVAGGRFEWIAPAAPCCTSPQTEPNRCADDLAKSPAAPLRQSQITEFLQTRKRTSNEPLSTSTSKRHRMNSPATARRT